MSSKDTEINFFLEEFFIEEFLPPGAVISLTVFVFKVVELA